MEDEAIRNPQEYWTSRELLENAIENNPEPDEQMAHFINGMKECIARYEQRIFDQYFSDDTSR